jgi:hypothetical protein
VPKYAVHFRANADAEVEVEAESRREAIAKAVEEFEMRDEPWGDFRPESLERTDTDDPADVWDIVGTCQACNRLVLEGDDYGHDEDGDVSCCGPCGRAFAATPESDR